MGWLTVCALQVREVEDVDGAAVWGGGGAAAEEGGLAFGVAGGEGGGGEEGEGEDGGGGEVHGGLWGWLGGWLVIVVGLEDWLRRWCWMCGKNVGFPLFFMVVCSGGFCIGLAVASIAGDAMTIVGIHSSSSSTAATNVLGAFWLWSCFLPSFDAGVSAEMRHGCWMVVI